MVGRDGISLLVGALFAFIVCTSGEQKDSTKEVPQMKGTTVEKAPEVDLQTSAKLFQLPSGGVSEQSLKSIKELMRVHLQEGEGSGVGSGVDNSRGGSTLPFRAPSAVNRYHFGHFRQKPRPLRNRYSTGGSGTDGGYRPQTGGEVGHGGLYGSSPPTQKPPKSGPFDLNLSLTDYKHIWVQMFQEIYKIIKDKSVLESSSFGTRVLDHLFYLLHDIKTLSTQSNEYIACPEIYHRVGDLCLSVDAIDEFLDFYEARLYCQMVKGGDLVMFRDANEFHDIISFLQTIDPRRQNSYWIGVSAEKHPGDFRFIDGRKLGKGPPYWGVNETAVPVEQTESSAAKRKNSRLLKERDDREKRQAQARPLRGNEFSRRQETDSELPQRTVGPFNEEDATYALLNKDDYWFIWNSDLAKAEELLTLPLCQYIPERDQSNFQYGEGIWNSWNEYNDLVGWTGGDSTIPGTSQGNQAGQGPLLDGYGFYGGGFSGPYRRSDGTKIESGGGRRTKKPLTKHRN